VKHPSDFELAFAFGQWHGSRKDGEQVGPYEAARALRPENLAVWGNLGNVLYGKGKVDEAIQCFKKAVALDQKNATIHYGLGLALHRKGKVEEAIASWRKAIEIDPMYALAHNGLGVALHEKGEVDEAIDCYHKAIALDPKLAAAHYALGNALKGKGKVGEAIACYRQALSLDPKLAHAHNNLGLALKDRRKVDEAINCFRKAIDIDPKLANAHAGLGQALLGKGRYAEARDATVQARTLLPTNHPLRARVSRQLQECQRLLKLEARLPGLLRGEDKAASAQESLAIATMCQHKRMHVTATRFFAEAFAADPKLATDLQAGHRYNAACHAARSAAGQREDGKLDDQQRLALRRRALTCLRADLTLWTCLVASGQVGRSRMAQVLSHWQKDSDLVGLRDKAALDRLSPEECAACLNLWADVAALLKNAGGQTRKLAKPAARAGAGRSPRRR
jgi:tetratricopeptide (TPR) repeat protein